MAAQPTLSPAQQVNFNAQKTYEKNTYAYLSSSKASAKCSAKHISVRRAWDDLSITERKSYIKAVKCLMSKPPKTPKFVCPGAQNQYDDFVYAHINQTNFIHLSGLLLPWHRQYIWAFEQALRNECGYIDALPYWAWERHTSDQLSSPVFGSDPESAFGGNGIPIGPHPGTNGSTIDQTPPFDFFQPPGTGGGCVPNGAFSNIKINLGPIAPVTSPANANKYGTAYNPRCIVRDMIPDLSVHNLTYEAIASLYSLPSIHAFNPLLQASIHILSHVFIGGSAVDFYSSPNDPVFFLLHAQVDRVWTIWQGLDLETRLTALDGTVTLANVPPSENVTLGTVMKMGVPAGGDVEVENVMNAVGGEYCYIYA